MPMIHSRVFFRPESGKHSQRLSSCWNIKATLARPGGIICDNIVFVHAILRCDTTSGAFGNGKLAAVTKIRNELHFLEQGQVSMRSTFSQEERKSNQNRTAGSYLPVQW
ncbi:hypothetical protein E2C01_041433 [Portunus trituberculatus]|uniref:Uncharacterized protein n=1 Tax=Portunus trituberculatus TaxID=210409 RepID=A0A5B7FQX4_PORTR|nr:hypothetical protein [Portunus trituberculatus]